MKRVDIWHDEDARENVLNLYCMHVGEDCKKCKIHTICDCHDDDPLTYPVGEMNELQAFIDEHVREQNMYEHFGDRCDYCDYHGECSGFCDECGCPTHGEFVNNDDDNNSCWDGTDNCTCEECDDCKHHDDCVTVKKKDEKPVTVFCFADGSFSINNLGRFKPVKKITFDDANYTYTIEMEAK